jgi:hypothetical protein
MSSPDSSCSIFHLIGEHVIDALTIVLVNPAVRKVTKEQLLRDNMLCQVPQASMQGIL